jgi:hypothetical protein
LNNDELVREHAFNPDTWAQGSIVKIWRFGSPGSGTSTSGAVSLLLTRAGGAINAKAGLSDMWTYEVGDAVDMQAAGGRIAFRNAAGEVYAKDGITGSWLMETSGVDQYVVTPDLLAIRVGGAIYAKANLSNTWSPVVLSGATSLEASGTRIAYQADGMLYARDGVTGVSLAEMGAVDQYVVTSSLLLARVGTTLYGKVNLSNTWSTLAYGAVDVQAAGNRIGIRDTNDYIQAKDGLSGTWALEYGHVDQWAITPDLLVVRDSGYLNAKLQLGDMWTTLAGGAVDMQVVGSRVAFRNAAGTLSAKEGLSGTWLTETGGIDEYLISG